jgi:hypothetical protein
MSRVRAPVRADALFLFIQFSFREKNEKNCFFCCYNSYVIDKRNIVAKEKQARIAQSVERVAFNHNVQGSSPCSGGALFYLFQKMVIDLIEFSTGQSVTRGTVVSIPHDIIEITLSFFITEINVK